MVMNPALLSRVRRLEPGENPFSLHMPREIRSAVVVDAPHSGLCYPSSGPELTERQRELMVRVSDTGVEAVLDRLHPLPYPVFCNKVMRGIVDLNRDRDDVEPSMIFDGWETPVNQWIHGAALGAGLFARICDVRGNAEPIYELGITRRDALQRLETVYDPCVSKLQGVLDKVHGTMGKVCYIGLHSCARWGTSNMAGGSQRRPDICVSDGATNVTVGRTAPQELTELVAQVFTDYDYETKINDPFAGGKAQRRHSNPEHNRFGLQVEMCKGTLLLNSDEETRLYDRVAIRRMSAAVETMLAVVSRFLS